MFAEETSSRSEASSKMRELPDPSPRSAFKSIVSGNQLLLAALLLRGAVYRLRLDDLPVFLVVLEAATREFGQELFPHDYRCQPIGITVLGLHWKPGELCAHALVADFAVRISSTLPLHFNASSGARCGPRAL